MKDLTSVKEGPEHIIHKHGHHGGEGQENAEDLST